MNLIRRSHTRVERFLGVCLAWVVITVACFSQGISTTTVQGTVYLANGSPGSGTLQISWPAFTTAASQSVAAGKITAKFGDDGFVSVNLTPNLGASPAGLFYTVVYHMSDGTTSTEYWVVPAAAQATIAKVRSQVMPAAQAAQAVSKAYVDQAIQSLAQGNLTSTGGQLTGPLYLTGDPTQSLQAADKHYVDATFAQAMPLTGGAASGPLTANRLGGAYQVDQFSGSDFGAKLQACLSAIDSTYGGTCDARNFSGTVSMSANLTISTANAAVLLPCATISTANQIIITAGTRNVSLRGCALRGSSNSSGSQGGTVLMYSGPSAAVQVGDKTYASDTLGFQLENVLINTTGSSSSATEAFAAYRTQEIDLQSLYMLGNGNQTGMMLDGTGNYSGGTFYDNHISGFQTAIYGVGHQVTNSAATDWLNASTFVRLHIDCPTNNGNPISGTYGVNLLQGDGNSFTGGDVEGCTTALHLGSNAQNNTILGLRNENSTDQVVAEPGSSYNSWITGGTMFTGRLVDNGTRNSFLDTFHRSFNSINGDWYGTQQDSTLTNHYRLGIGSGNERGLLDRYQTDYGYRWTMGLSDATAGEQFYQLLDELNNVYRISVGQYNNGQASTNNQTVINAAGTGAVVLNGSNNSGTGGVVLGSGGPNETTVATVSNTGNAQFNGTLQVGGTAQTAGTMTVRNNADSEVDYYLWPGLTASQKGSFTYKDYNGNSQWYMVKDVSNNWALNSAVGGLDSFKAYQSTNSGDTYINASNSAGVVRVNYEPGTGSAFNIYGGNSSNLYAGFSGANAIKFPGLSASTGHNCLQIDSSGYISNTGAVCGTGSGTVNNGNAGQIAYYNGNGTAVSGMTTIPVSAGGTGATTAAAALGALGGASLSAAAEQKFTGPVTASINSQINVMAPPYNAKGDCVTDDSAAVSAAQADAVSGGWKALYFPRPPGGCYVMSINWQGVSLIGAAPNGALSGASVVQLRGLPGQDVLHVQDPTTTAGWSWNKGWTIENISIRVNNSVAGSFLHRWPGRWFDDASMTSGSAVLTTANGEVSCADVGQAIQVNGAGASGANLVTTVQSVSPCFGANSSWVTITLANAASTTVTNAHAYVSALGLPVTSTIGACAIAFDNYDGNPSNWSYSPTSTIGNAYDTIRNIVIDSTSGQSNNACGIYTQGAWGPYGLDVQNFTFRQLVYGVVQSSSELNSSYQSDSNDFQKWNHGSMESVTSPWIQYNGGYGKLEDIELTTTNGPVFLGLGNRWYDSNSGTTINITEHEGETGQGWRVAGTQLTFDRNNFGAAKAIIHTAAATCTACIGAGDLELDGNNNKFDFAQDLSTHNITNGGLNNKITYRYLSNPINGLPSNYSLSPIPMKRFDVRGILGPDYISDGNYGTPYNSDDLVFWPQDYNQNSSNGPWSAFVASDGTSPTGAYMIVHSGHAMAGWAQYGGSSPVVGTNIPAGKVVFSMLAKCDPGVTTFTFFAGVTGGTYGYNRFYSHQFGGCTTSYQPFSTTVDFTNFPGGNVMFGTSDNSFYAAWAAITPYKNSSFHNISTDLVNGGPVPVSDGTIYITARDWYWGAYGSPDSVSPVGYSTNVGNAWALTKTAGGNTNLNGGNLYPAVQSNLGVAVQAPSVITDTLNGAISNTATSITVNTPSTSAWASNGCFLVDQEIMCYTGGTPAVGTTSFTVNRAQGGTLVQAHNNGATMYSMGTGVLYVNCNGANIASLNLFFEPSYNYFWTPFPAQSCSGYATTFQTAFESGPTGQAFNFAAIAIRPQPEMSGTTANIGGSALAVGTCASGTANITGATTSMVATASPVTYPGDSMEWKAYVSSPGVVTVKVCAIAAGTPIASTYNVRVIQ